MVCIQSLADTHYRISLGPRMVLESCSNIIDVVGVNALTSVSEDYCAKTVMVDVAKQDRSCPKQQPAPTLVPTLVIISAEIMNADETAEMNCTIDRLGLPRVSFSWLLRKMAARHDNSARNSPRSEVDPTTEAYLGIWTFVTCHRVHGDRVV